MPNRFDLIPPANWERAREMRSQPTSAEKILWQALRNERLGVRFRRQHPIGPYIADFYCWEERLVVEVDGDPHASSDAMDYDQVRDQYMKKLGLTVLRYQNLDVMNCLRSVVEDMMLHLHSQTPPQPSP